MTRTWPWLLLLVALFLAAAGEFRCAWGQEISTAGELCLMPEPAEPQGVQDIVQNTCVADLYLAKEPLLRFMPATAVGGWNVPILRLGEEVVPLPAREQVYLVYGHTNIVIEGPDAVALAARIRKALARGIP